MKTTHTPGPWNIIHRTQTDGTIWIQGPTTDESGWREVCSLPYWPSRNRELEAANARLIAAAPDLLAALQAAEAVVENFTLGAQGDDDPDFGGEFATLAQIRAAIAKATP
jgi:hypothetical protein